MFPMPHNKVALLVLAGAVALGAAGVWAAAEAEVSLDSIPEPARTALQEIHDRQGQVARRFMREREAGELKVGPITRVTKDKEDGVDTYQGEWQVGEMDHSATVTDAGGTIEVQTELPAARVPAAVSAAIAAKFGKAPDASYSLINTFTWDVEVTAAGKTHFVTVLPTGKIQDDELAPDNGK
jgi:hypothetical protein